jgi:hypothetical protein
MDKFWEFVAQKLRDSGQFSEATAIPVVEKRDEYGDSLPAERTYHDAAKAYLDQQFASNRDLDARIGLSTQVGSLVVTITFGLLALGKTQVNVPDLAKSALVVALAAYCLVLLLAMIASRFSSLSHQPDIPTLSKHVDDYSGVDLLYWIASEYQISGEINEDRLKWKRILVGLLVFFLYLEGFSLALAAVFTL